MPGQKRRYNVRFPPRRIKKIMQKDTEVGRMAMAVPVIISRALEIFLKSLLTKTCVITESKLSTVVSVAHMKQCIESEKLFHFLKDLVAQTTPTTQKDNRGMRTNSMKFLLKNHLKWRKWLRKVASTHLTTTRVPASRSSTSAYDCATSGSRCEVTAAPHFIMSLLLTFVFCLCCPGSWSQISEAKKSQCFS
ncbi:dr1-associated corepressor isoform X1 [Oreochromis aureus]|uniref:Transcription factor CBF/NF-Y/archaeal histone domain-containing protein n=1 Tax=Oreochromis aureus TaxID=47969 RepID=A0A668VK09_OREAU|nr:dr1-associated corepressor isoform X1 [Oreochromis aureus]